MVFAPMMNRAEAEEVVRLAYERALGRNPLPSGLYDSGSLDYLLDLVCGVYADGAAIERVLRNSDEAHSRAERIVRALYRNVLARDPGPAEVGGPWADPAALAYVEDFRLGRKTEDAIRAELEGSPEAQAKLSRATRPEVLDNVLNDTESGRKDFELGISLFYAISPDVSDADFSEVVSELAAMGIRQVRLAGSTYTWDNPPKMRNVIPFRSGTSYVHGDGIDAGVGVDPIADPAHLSKLSVRLKQLCSNGIRAQYTIFWGGMQPLFTREGREVRWERVRPYLRDLARFFRAHPEHTIEIINEADHGHHLARLGQDGRAAFLHECARIIRTEHPHAILTASDGGRQPEDEGDPYFAYGPVKPLDYWNVHYPRDTVAVDGIPRWARGPWHLYQDRGSWRSIHGSGGYGRSDENMFLTTDEEFQTWGYRGSTRDWQMYGLSLWVTTMAGAAFTLHTFKGFFCRPGLTRDPIFRVVRGWNELTQDFAWHGATSYNAGWARSPVKSYDESFKVFSLVSGENGRDVLVTVLNPLGRIVLQMDRPRTGGVYEITGEPLLGLNLHEGENVVTLPTAAYPHACVLRLNESR
jgi:hypothetical protein